MLDLFSPKRVFGYGISVTIQIYFRQEPCQMAILAYIQVGGTEVSCEMVYFKFISGEIDVHDSITSFRNINFRLEPCETA